MTPVSVAPASVCLLSFLETLGSRLEPHNGASSFGSLYPMRSISLGAAALALLAAEPVMAVEEALLKGFSQAVRGQGYLALPVGTVQRPAGMKRATGAFEDQLYNMEFFYATDGELHAA